MGQQLYATQPVFRAAIDECAAKLTAYLDTPLLDILYPADGNPAPLMATMTYSQPAIFALAYALASLWQSWGIRPSVVLGHSIGEYVAACIAGVYSLDDALKLVAARGRLMDAAPDTGMMATIFATEETVQALLAPYPAEVALAAINAPTRVVISGTQTRVEAILQVCEQQGIEVRRLQVAQAGHSPLLEPILDEFEQVAQTIRYHPPGIPLVAGLTGTLVQGDAVGNATYWRRHLREPVPFTTMVQTLAAQGVGVYLELGSHPMLVSLGPQIVPDAEDMFWVASLHREREHWSQIATGLGNLYLAGVAIDWAAVYPADQHRRVPLPTYPFQRERHWVDAPMPLQQMPVPAMGVGSTHPLLGVPISLAGDNEWRFQSVVTPSQFPWLRDHWVFQTVVMPGVAYIEMALSLGRILFGTDRVRIDDLLIQQAMVWQDEAEMKLVQVVCQPGADPSWSFEIWSVPQQIHPAMTGSPASAEQLPWVCHATGTIAVQHEQVRDEWVDVAALLAPASEIAVDTIYQREHERQFDFGPSFMVMERLWCHEQYSIGTIQVPPHLHSEPTTYQIHPLIIEGCHLTFTVLYPIHSYVPISIRHIHFYGGNADKMWCQAIPRSRTNEGDPIIRADMHLIAPDGRVILKLEEVLYRLAQRETMVGDATANWENWLYTITWQAQKISPARAAATGRWLVVNAACNREHGYGERLISALEAQGQIVVAVAADAPAELAAVLTNDAPLAGVVYLATARDGDPATIPAQTAAVYTGALHLAQALVQHGVGARLWLVSRGSQAVRPGDTVQVNGSVLWGLGRTLRHEYPELAATMVDLPAAPTDNETAWLVAELVTAPDDMHVAYRNGQRFIAHLARYQPRTTEPVFPISSDASYLITGGLGGIGLTLARVLVDQGARHIVLSGRSGTCSEQARQMLAELQQQSATVQIVQADISQYDDTARLLAACNDLAPLKGIIHAAGLLDDGILLQQTTARYQHIAAAKVDGSWYLHRLTRDLALDFLVFCSSESSLLGNAGQANYAAANAFLDGLALHRQAQGLPALSINWGTWSEVGLAAQRAREGAIQIAPAHSLTPEQGAAVFQLVLHQPVSQIGVLPGLEQRNSNGLWQQERSPATAPVTVSATTLRQRLAQTDPGERQALLTEHVQQQIGHVLGRSGAVPMDESFFNLGMESLMVVELRNALQKSLECRLPGTLAFDYPTGDALVGYLVETVLTNLFSQQQQPFDIRPVPRTDTLALSFSQMRFWVLQMARPNDSFYNIQQRFQIIGSLDTNVLEHSLNILIERHEVLRTTFPLVNGQPVQAIADHSTITLDIRDVQDIHPDDQPAEMEYIIRTEVERPFDLATGPLMRILLLHQAADTWLLVVCFHHIVLDEWSLTILYRELAVCYTAITSGQPVAIPPLSIQYADYAAWQHQQLTPEIIASRRAYWETLLADEPAPCASHPNQCRQLC
ncbi:MAG: SDR family NAD(P)-dependent oxidoreductase [Chloroflexaceae bacterium]|nr:SDR family NAD(P)-dependent oxidoreductase [Chloroflexaceae bacterium]